MATAQSPGRALHAFLRKVLLGLLREKAKREGAVALLSQMDQTEVPMVFTDLPDEIMHVIKNIYLNEEHMRDLSLIHI
mgnify:CR=1 FL=1